MPILDTHREYRAALHSVREVRIPIAVERRAAVERFYLEILNMTLWPADRQIPGGLGCGDPRRGLYLQYRHDPTADPLRRRFVLAVPSLEETQRRLEQHEWPYERLRGFGLSDECVCVLDPIGHRVELRQIRPI